MRTIRIGSTAAVLVAVCSLCLSLAVVADDGLSPIPIDESPGLTLDVNDIDLNTSFAAVVIPVSSATPAGHQSFAFDETVSLPSEAQGIGLTDNQVNDAVVNDANLATHGTPLLRSEAQGIGLMNFVEVVAIGQNVNTAASGALPFEPG